MSKKRINSLCLGFLVMFEMIISAKGSFGEYDLKQTLQANYIKTVRPVKNYSDTVQVKFDIALRTVVDLEEKNQLLTTSVWIRIYWKDENLVWDPKNYSNIQSSNFLPREIWTPDVVLYNSADETGRGNMEIAMQTNIIVYANGDCQWFCPVILKTECSVDITYFPFDRQKCPMRFGLWTYDALRANFSIVRNEADTSSLVPSGEWNLEGMPAVRKVFYYACCPGLPFPALDYEVIIVRRTSFYLLNLIWPGILIAILASITFLLPPESGERIGLGITNLLAMMVFLLLISESIPPTSDAVPLASNFFSVILVLSALALIESCIVIKFLHYADSDVTDVPKFIRYFVNDFLARIVCIDGCRVKRKSADLYESKGIENPTMNGNSHEDIVLQTRAGTGEQQTHARAPHQKPSRAELEIADGMRKIVGVISKQVAESEARDEWRRAIQVVDRFATLIFFLVLIGACTGIFLSSPRFFIK